MFPVSKISVLILIVKKTKRFNFLGDNISRGQWNSEKRRKICEVVRSK